MSLKRKSQNEASLPPPRTTSPPPEELLRAKLVLDAEAREPPTALPSPTLEGAPPLTTPGCGDPNTPPTPAEPNRGTPCALPEITPTGSPGDGNPPPSNGHPSTNGGSMEVQQARAGGTADKQELTITHATHHFTLRLKRGALAPREGEGCPERPRACRGGVEGHAPLRVCASAGTLPPRCLTSRMLTGHSYPSSHTRQFLPLSILQIIPRHTSIRCKVQPLHVMRGDSKIFT
jgi:hypothetical protein